MDEVEIALQAHLSHEDAMNVIKTAKNNLLRAILENKIIKKKSELILGEPKNFAELASALVHLGIAYYRVYGTRKNEAAIAFMNVGLILEAPAHVAEHAYYHLGLCYMDSGERSRARYLFSRILPGSDFYDRSKVQLNALVKEAEDIFSKTVKQSVCATKTIEDFKSLVCGDFCGFGDKNPFKNDTVESLLDDARVKNRLKADSRNASKIDRSILNVYRKFFLTAAPIDVKADLRTCKLTLAKPSLSFLSWNIQATRPEHKITTNMLQTKCNKIAKATSAAAEKVSCMVFTECPGAFIEDSDMASQDAKACVGIFDEMITKTMNVQPKSSTACWKALSVGVDNKKIYGEGVRINEGEQHVFCYDESVLTYEEGSARALFLHEFPEEGKMEMKDRPFARSPTYAAFKINPVDENSFERKLHIISVHLKSVATEDKSDTQNEVRSLSTLAVPQIEGKVDENDILVVTGDFNLDPRDDAFDGLKDMGFEYNGDYEYTNMHEFCAVAKEVYDSCWILQGKNHNFISHVYEPPELTEAAKDLHTLVEIMNKFARVDATSYIAKQEGFLAGAIRNAFKKQVNHEYSDHKWICCELALGKKKNEKDNGENSEYILIEWFFQKIEGKLLSSSLGGGETGEDSIDKTFAKMAI